MLQTSRPLLLVLGRFLLGLLVPFPFRLANPGRLRPLRVEARLRRFLAARTLAKDHEWRHAVGNVHGHGVVSIPAAVDVDSWLSSFTHDGSPAWPSGLLPGFTSPGS